MISSHQISFRTATIDDLSVLEHWDRQQHVIDSDPDDDWNWREELQWFPSWRQQLIAELHGRPLGFVQIIDPAKEETHYWGKVEDNLRAIDIWIGEQQDLGKGYGTVMMTKAINRCFAEPQVTAILIDPLATNHRAIRFYEKLGFHFVEDRQFGNSHCKVYRLEREAWELRSDK